MGASRVACASFNLGTNTTITITRDNKAYTHTLKYSFNGATGTIVEKTTQTNYVWTPPTSTFYSKIPNVTSGYGTITCETYNGTTLVGTTTCGFYAYTVRSACEPTVSGTVVDTNASTIALTGNSSTMVLYMSKPKCTLSATAKNSATIKTIQIENPVGLVATTSPYTFSTVYSDEFRFKATDSRGYSKTTTVKAPKFILYEPCYFETTPVVTRTESTSTTATATLKGYCFKGSFGSVSNAITVKYRLKTSSGSYGSYVTVTPTWNTDGTFTATVSIANLTLNETYTIEFVVSDKLTSFPVETVLGSGMGDLRIGKNYIQTKNDFIIGDDNSTDWRNLRVQRKIGEDKYFTNIAMSSVSGASTVCELYKRHDSGSTLLGRVDLRSNGHLYNYLTSMSFAEIMAMIPTMASSGNRGYLLLNGGDSNPCLLQWGRINKVPDGANVVTSVDIGFIYEFSGQPIVFVGSVHNLSATLEIASGSPTTEGCTLYLKRANTGNTGLFWLAIGNGSNALPE